MHVIKYDSLALRQLQRLISHTETTWFKLDVQRICFDVTSEKASVGGSACFADVITEAAVLLS